MKYYQKALYLEMENFYLITGEAEVESLKQIRAKMGVLVRKARKALAHISEPKAQIHQLLQLMYGDWGFYCDSAHYFESENLYLNHILKRRQGMPASLGAIVLYLAESLSLPVYPVNFPTQLILRAEVENEVAFIDPWNGRYISLDYLRKLYQGAYGFGAELSMQELDRVEIEPLAERFRQLAKNALIREEKNDAAYKYIERLLLLSPQDPFEIRDRGLVLAQMGCYHAAAEDLQYFIEHCPQDPTAFLLTAQMAELKQEFYDIH
ncbi:SirB1 family protein [Mesocricetibacter intestinalis]|uniref:SirB1 family protein n=1 Tax=Mesocricetibacter intestinalis TaxID=1521930 RepID=UPI001060EFA4|nr:SirB1 family protein [Mesocricetibacter intestinalis]